MWKTMSGVALIVLVCLCAGSRAACLPSQANDLTPLLKPYPHSDAFDYIIRTHQNQSFRPFGYDFPPEKRAETANPPLVLYATWFLRGEPGIAMQYTVDAFGRVNTVRSCYNWADQDCQMAQATPAVLSQLRRDIAALPAGSQLSSLDRLLIVSFYRDQRWTTRLYDRTEPPIQVRRLYKLTADDPFWRPSPVPAGKEH